jgi:hypothetical protein
MKSNSELPSIGVKCLRCAGIIVIAPSEMRADELSLPCPHCGRRAIYSSHETFSMPAAEAQKSTTQGARLRAAKLA